MKIKLLFVLMLGLLLSSCTPWVVAQTDNDVYSDSVTCVDTESYSRVYLELYWGWAPYYYYPYYYSYYYWPDYYYYYPYYYPDYYYYHDHYYHSRPHYLAANHHYSFYDRRPMNTHRTQISNTAQQIRRQPIKRERIYNNTRELNGNRVAKQNTRGTIKRKEPTRSRSEFKPLSRQRVENNTPKVHTRPTGNTSKQSVSQSHRSSGRSSVSRKR